ncbi:MAG: spore germination protein GerW family protein [Acutalibacteraceae bacterium]|jgi:sporulation protein YtfJ|nr:sporulation protein YtfJ [Clostridia bacterium]MEE0980567.1 spore germination protein GerW family protein [Acutalibacteraceae bacterium]
MKDQSASGILATAIDRIKEMVDCQTIIGDTIDAGEGIRIIPISKVTYGFASGGSDFPTKTSKELFGGGGGAGVTISPVAFLVIKDGDVSVKYVSEGAENSAERIISMVPDVVNKVTDVVTKFKSDKTTDVVDSVFEDIE